jgi:hypothetical protein
VLAQAFESRGQGGGRRKPTTRRTGGNGAGTGRASSTGPAARGLSTSALIAYVTIGVAATIGRSVVGAVGAALTWVRSRDGGPTMRHTLRIDHGDLDGAESFAYQGGATHRIVYNPATRYAQAVLAHEFAHILLAVVRGGPAEQVGVPTHPAARLESAAAHVEESAAWALAKAITCGTIWHGAALTYSEGALGEDGLPLWVRAPRIPPPLLPTRALVRWLAQVEP